MARVGVSGYASVNARVRVMYASLIAQQDFARLYEAPDFNTFNGLLARTPYGPYLDQAKEKALTPRRAAYHVRGRLAEAYLSIIHAAPAHAQPLLTQLYRHFEVNNLKAILRGIVTHASWDQVRYVLFPVGGLSVLRPEEMMESGNLTNVIDLLRGTPYFETVSHAMRRYSTEQNIFTLEVAIDLDYWRRLWREVKALPNQDRIPAEEVLGALVDMNNLMWAIRYRVFHHLSEEELINYTLPFGRKVKDDSIRAIAAGADYMQVVGKIFPRIGRLDLFSEEPENRLIELERNLQLNLVEQCRAAFVGDSFNVGTLLAYLLMCEMEVQDLTVLLEAKGQQLPLNAFQRFLVMNGAEVER